jgi:NADH-quinone oxidoreductase subunit L
MTGPLVALAVCAVFVGFWQGWLVKFIGFTPQLATDAIVGLHGETEFHIQIAAISTIVALAGICVALFLYLESRREIDWFASFMSFQWYHRLLDADRYARMRRWAWVNAVQQAANRVYLGWLAVLIGRIVQMALWIISAPLILFSFVTPYRLSAGKFYFDEIYEFVIVRPMRGLADLFYALDQAVIDGAVNALGRVPLRIGNLMRSLQMGLVQFYALCMALGMLLLVLVRVLWSS